MNKDIIQTTNKKYIRFGNIPENEVSGIWCDTIKVGEEKGVSVYDAVMIEGQWRVVLPFPLKKEVGFDLYNFIGGTENGNLSMYLVEGDYIGKGTTNEPLLKNIRIIQRFIFPELKWEDEPIEVELRPTITDLDTKAKEYAYNVTDNEELREMIVNAFKAGYNI